ncbi:RPA-interacting protein B-like [Hydractinia symbiolongicarpus]|uniref:RPA-interacting protein B-like n=1 Tax=Hydractinia symbiolongicarpus TaxID=13093 RepID=UPI00254BFD06|nr:RPA-interacting protein B-like [Hydractinia symbiolongicarpus]XP_057294354.1 RPA-interacting protein B-like [Hydractinia symbiolongicarpus]
MEKTPERKKRTGLKDRTPTGAWRERFRQGCLNRLKSKRHELVSNIRQASEKVYSPHSSQEFVSNLMTDEWKKMKLESPLLSSLPHCRRGAKENFEFDDLDSFELDEILGVFESVQQELLKEEQRLLVEYEDLVAFDEQCLCAAIDLLSTDAITCPVCKRNNLLQNESVIFCMCGLRIDTQHDAIDLKYVQSQLSDAILAHSSTCSQEPEFVVVDYTGLDDMKNLMLTCRVCDCMSIII